MTINKSNDGYKGAFDKASASGYQGSGPAFGGYEEAAEVEGHLAEDNSSALHDAGTASDDETAEVEGHLHPILTEDYSRVLAANTEADIVRAERARAAQTGRDGGVLDKILRRKTK